MSQSAAITIAGRPIGPQHPPYIVAEVSANHAGSIERALEIIDEAARAGADAVKLQTYTADTMTIAHTGDEFMIRGGLWAGYSLYDLYKEAHTPWQWHAALFARARSHGMGCFSTPFDDSAIDFLETLDTPAYKIASFELTDLELIRKAASTGKPLIMSTGLANEGEIREAVDAAREVGSGEIVLLHCVSAYPAAVADANLRTIAEAPERFGVPVVGLSDHTLSPAVAVAAVALGASVIEKHFTARRSDGGPDSTFSLEPAELAELVSRCRDAYASLGTPTYDAVEGERANLKFRRSIYVVRDIEAGEALTKENVRIIRPAFGLAPRHYPEVLGRRARRKLERGTALDISMLD